MELPETIAFEKQQERLRKAGLLDERYYDDEGNRLKTGPGSSWAGQAQMALQLGQKNTTRSDKWSANEIDLYWAGVAKEKKKEQDEIEANLFTVQTPRNNQGAAFNNEMNALLYTGTTISEFEALSHAICPSNS